PRRKEGGFGLMRLRDIKDTNDLKDMSGNDVVDLLDELRAIATKRGTELLQQGRVQARKAIGAPEPGAVSSAFLFGIVLGAAVGAGSSPRGGAGGARGRRGQRARQRRDGRGERRAGAKGRYPSPPEEIPDPRRATTPARPPAWGGGRGGGGARPSRTRRGMPA